MESTPDYPTVLLLVFWSNVYTEINSGSFVGHVGAQRRRTSTLLTYSRIHSGSQSVLI